MPQAPRALRVLRLLTATGIGFMPVAAMAASGEGGTVQNGFRLLDWLVLAVYVIVLLAIGFRYSRRQDTTEAFFLANRNMKPFMAGISLVATLISTISYIALPGELIQNGPVYACLYIAALPITYFLVGWLIIPAIMRLRITSAYEMLEARLGRPVRITGSVTFILTRLVWMTLMLHTTARVLVGVLGWNPSWITPVVVIIGLVTTIYTLCGGIGAVIITDVVQFFVLVLGALVTLVCIAVQMHGADWWPEVWQPHWAPQPFFTTDPQVRVTMLGTLVCTVILWVCTTASDQLAVQRCLTTRDAASARRAFLINNAGDAAITAILTVVGLALLAFYRHQPGALPAGTSLSHNGDGLFPHYISHYLPAGVSGLVISGILAAAMSSLSSGINSIIAVFSKDIIETQRPDAGRTEAAKVRTARFLALAIGLLTIAGSTVIGLVPGNLLEVTNKTVALLMCPMFGLFFLAIFVPFATPFGAVLGALCSFASAFIVAYWDLLTGRPGMSFQWIAPTSFAVSIGASCLLSLLPTRQLSTPARLTWGTAVLAAFVTGFWLLARAFTHA